MFLENNDFKLKPNKEKLLSSTHAPRILILYGSLRDRSFSRLLAEEAGRMGQPWDVVLVTTLSDSMVLMDTELRILLRACELPVTTMRPSGSTARP